MQQDGSETRVTPYVAVIAATTLAFVHLALGNAALFPLFDAVWPLARDVNVGFGLAANLLMLLVATRRPHLLRCAVLASACATLSVAGFALTLGGLGAGSAPLLCVGTALLGAGGAAVALACGLARCVLPHRLLLASVPAAYGAAQVLGWALLQAPAAVGIAAEGLCPLAVLALSLRSARRMVEATRNAPAQADAQLLHPGSYLPLTSKVYAGIFAVTVALAFNLRFGPVEGSLGPVALNLAVCAACMVPALQGTGRMHFDALFACAVTLVVGGFLMAPLASMGGVTSALITMGGALTNTLFAIVLTSAASRNPASSVAVLSWGNALSSGASIVGANVGAFVGRSSSDAAFVLSALVAAGLVLYVLLGMRGFSFDEAIAGIAPLEPLRASETSEERLARVCGELGAAAGLTPRETEVLSLLARGRNNAYIQEELSLTRNTVKTYVKRIYAKLDVHSQQEVIDLVDNA